MPSTAPVLPEPRTPGARTGASARPGAPAPRTADRPRSLVALLGALVIAAGVVLALSGAGTWAVVQTSLSAERITVSADAARFVVTDLDSRATLLDETFGRA